MLTNPLNSLLLRTNLWSWDWWFSIEYCVCDVENEWAMKVVEEGMCDEKLNEHCQESKCNNDCVRKHGNSAIGSCNAIKIAFFAFLVKFFIIQHFLI